MFLLARDGEFERFDGEVARSVTELISCSWQTALDENGFKIQREAEHKSYNARVSNMRRWASLFESKVATTRFSFQELPGWEDEAVDPANLAQKVNGLFTSLVKLASAGLRSIVGPKRDPAWHNPAPTRGCIVDADLDLCRELNDRHDFHLISKVGLGCLPSGPCMAVRNRKRLGDKWFVPFCGSSYPVRFGWPLQEQHICGSTYWRLGCAEMPAATPFLHVLDLGGWDACGNMWTCPLDRMAKHGAKASVEHGILAR